jgi:glycosyltransferase involved in cell wall biosynthesis
VEAAAAAEFRRAHGVPASAPLLVCVARLEPQKDHATLLDAIARLPAEPRVHVVLLGRGSLEQAIRERAAAIDGHRVVLGGFVADPAPGYAAADVVVLSSRHEGLGLALVEAAQHGRPVVATAVGGVPEVVGDGETGLLVPAGNPDALASALTSLISDEAECRRLGTRARDVAGARFSLDAYAASLDGLYRRVLRGSP